MTNPFVNHRAVLAVRAQQLSPLAADVEFPAGVRVSARHPFALDGFWTRELGADFARAYDSADLYLVCERSTTKRLERDRDRSDIVREVVLAWWAILICGVPRVERILLAVGSEHDAGHLVRQCAHLDPPIPGQLAYGASLGLDCLNLAARVFEGLRRSDSGGRNFIRVRRGFDALRQALQAHDGGERLHQCIRAFEALVKPERGKSEERLKSRSEELIGPRLHDVIGELYRLRCQIEHMNEFSLDLRDDRAQTDDELSAIRLHQAERLSCAAYSRIFSTPALLERFVDDSAIDAFWRLRPDERRELWGPPIDLDDSIRRSLALSANAALMVAEISNRVGG